MFKTKRVLEPITLEDLVKAAEKLKTTPPTTVQLEVNQRVYDNLENSMEERFRWQEQCPPLGVFGIRIVVNNDLHNFEYKVIYSDYTEKTIFIGR